MVYFETFRIIVNNSFSVDEIQNNLFSVWMKFSVNESCFEFHQHFSVDEIQNHLGNI